MRIAIGSDHAGFSLKNHLRDALSADGYVVQDVGALILDPADDYPDFAALVGQAVASGKAKLGILVCGTGAGIGMAANKIPGVRAAPVSEPVTARLARSHNDANVVCIGERIVGIEVAEEIVRAFLATPFSEGERHIRRIKKIIELETGG